VTTELIDAGTSKKKKKLKSLKNTVSKTIQLPFWNREHFEMFGGENVFIDPIFHKELLTHLWFDVHNSNNNNPTNFLETKLEETNDLLKHSKVKEVFNEIFKGCIYKKYRTEKYETFVFTKFPGNDNIDMAIYNAKDYFTNPFKQEKEPENEFHELFDGLSQNLYILLTKSEDQRCLIIPTSVIGDSWLEHFKPNWLNSKEKKALKKSNHYFYNCITSPSSIKQNIMKLNYYDGYFTRSAFIRGLKQAIELKGDWKRDY